MTDIRKAPAPKTSDARPAATYRAARRNAMHGRPAKGNAQRGKGRNRKE